MSQSRRSFFKFSALATGGLAISYKFAGIDGVLQEDSAFAAGNGLEFGPFLKIHPDNTVEFFLDRVEMGQGTQTSQCTLLCEELDYPPQNVKVIPAPPGSSYVNTLFNSQMTGGSTSVVEGHLKLREAGAEAKSRLLKAGARAFNVDERELAAEDGYVFLRSSPEQRKSYGELATAAASMSAGNWVLKDWKDHKYVGKSIPRLDAAEKSTGQAVYAIDAAPEGALVAVLARPAAPGAKLDSFTDLEALQVPGVKKIFACLDGVAVVAEKYWQAKSARDKLDIRWVDDQAFQMSNEALRKLYAEQAHLEGDVERDDGHFDETYRKATEKLMVDYEVPYLAHATLEPQSATCVLRERGRSGSPEVEIWSCSQVPDAVVVAVAEAMGIEREQVIFHNHTLGGGFGRRLRPDYILEAVEIARRSELKVPIQLIWSREDDMKHDDFRPMTVCRMMGCLDEKKRVSGFFYRNASQSILRQFVPDFAKVMLPAWFPKGLSRFLGKTVSSFAAGQVAIEGVKDSEYDFPNFKVEYREVTLPVRVGFWRSVGHSINGFVMEGFVDELAHLAQQDPLEFRRQHIKEGDRRLAVLNRVAELAGWGQELPEGVHQGIAVHKSFNSYVAQVARVRVEGRKVVVSDVFCVVDCGRVINPQIVKEQMESSIVYGLSAVFSGEVTYKDGVPEQSNFHDYPVLRHNEHPTMHIEILKSEEEPTGVGEPGLPPIAAAVTNAIYAATGERLRRLPLSRSFV